MLRTVRATRYVTPLREGGSLPAIVEADDDGLYVVKFRGAGQGPRALVAELVAGELARALGLPVPELVFVEVDPALGRAEPDSEIRELVTGSVGVNLGLDYLPGSITFNPAADPAPDAELAADVVWFDSFVTNPDRMPQNPNLLMWHDALWLIDHGASLYVHHGWDDPEGSAAGRFALVSRHVLLPCAGSIAAADARLAPLVDEPLLRKVTDAVPDEWLDNHPEGHTPAEQREDYVRYLLRRLELREGFVAQAEEGRHAVA